MRFLESISLLALWDFSLDFMQVTKKGQSHGLAPRCGPDTFPPFPTQCFHGDVLSVVRNLERMHAAGFTQFLLLEACDPLGMCQTGFVVKCIYSTIHAIEWSTDKWALGSSFENSEGSITCTARFGNGGGLRTKIPPSPRSSLCSARPHQP